MGLDLNHAGEQAAAEKTVGRLGQYDLGTQCLRILRCTAKAMASSPGGLRFRAGTRPWLEGVPGGRRESAVFQAANE